MLLTVSGLQQRGALAAVVTLIHVHMFAVPVMPADSRATQVWWHPGWAAGHRRTGPCRRMASLTDASPSGQESTWCNEGRTGLHQTMSTGVGQSWRHAWIVTIQQRLMDVAHAQLDAIMVVCHIDGSRLARLSALAAQQVCIPGFPAGS